jgi:hypothetical protein
MTRHLLPFVASALIGILTSNTAAPAVIYDNTSSTSMNSAAYTPFQIGNEVLPAGTDRNVTLLEIGVFSQGFAETATLQAFLYINNGTGGQPGTLLWQSAVMTNVPLTGARNDLIDFPVPDVLVPGDFTWALQISNVSGPAAAGLPAYGPPSVGSSTYYSWSGLPGSWTKVGSLSSPQINLARITAITIPEPSSIHLLGIGLGLVFILALMRQQSNFSRVA